MYFEWVYALLASLFGFVCLLWLFLLPNYLILARSRNVQRLHTKESGNISGFAKDPKKPQQIATPLCSETQTKKISGFYY